MDDVERSDDKSGAGPLFSRAASDNVEIVDPNPTVRDGGLWTVSANDPQQSGDDGGSVSTIGGDPDPWEENDDGLWDLIEEDQPRVPPFPPPPFGQPYRSPLADTESMSEGVPGEGRWADWPEHDPSADVGADTAPNPDTSTVIDDVFDTDETFEDFVDEPIVDEEFTEYTDDAPPMDGRDTVGSLFRSEPVERHHDVIDAQDDPESEPMEDLSGPSPFSSASRSDDHDLFGVPGGTVTGFGRGQRASTGGQRERVPHSPHPEVDEADLAGEATTPGFLDAVNALEATDRERARMALVAVGALLGDDEEVVGLVVGQMLGHVAVLALTVRRVLVVNDRSWQPVVDQYGLDADLEIRGRHDSTIAAIGLGDGRQLSMVDGIRDVSAAIALVERIRSLTGVE